MKSYSSFSLIAAAAAAACLLSFVDAQWPNICTPTVPGPYSAWNYSRCPASATCALNNFSLSGVGCSPFVNAVECSPFQTCPESTVCVLAEGSGNTSDYHNVYNCTTSGGEFVTTSLCPCKYGPPLPPSTTLKNILIIGDSISIGYTPFVAAALADIAQVQHAPWSSDGGAEESAYSLQCIDYWLNSPSGMPFNADFVYFNNGMHNSGQGASWIVPGQSGSPADYPSQIANLTSKLIEAVGVKKLLFGITSPMLCNQSIDAVITGTLNPAAVKVMSAAKVPTVDLHAAVVAECGPVPQSSCFNLTGCFCPHCNNAGYQWMAESIIAPAIRSALKALDASPV